jgi:hypothetical protein
MRAISYLVALLLAVGLASCSSTGSKDDGARSDTYSFTCHHLDLGYERTLCTTSLPCSQPAQCPATAPVQCLGVWTCLQSTCAYQCWRNEAGTEIR